MGEWTDKRNRAQRKILRTFSALDTWNIEHKEAKQLDIDRLSSEIMIEFECSDRTAQTWIKDAKKMYELSHEAMLKQEHNIRKEYSTPDNAEQKLP